MNRTLTATVALAAALGIAGIAQAQTTASSSTQPGAPNMTTPTTQDPSGASSLPSSAAPTNPSAMNQSGPMTPAAPAGNTGMNPSAAAVPNAASPPAMNNQPLGTQPSASASAATMGSKQSTMSQPDIEQAQNQLKAQGLYRGAIDGVVGPETQQALMRFQHRNGLPESAALDQQTLDRLNGQGQNSQQAAPQSR